MSELARWRSLLGRSAVLWAGANGVQMRQSSWVAVSGCTSAEFNVALCYGASDRGDEIRQTIDDLSSARVPAVVMVAGEALGDVQVFINAGWICVGTVPFMSRELGLELVTGARDENVRKLVSDELAAARGLLEEAFDFTPELAAVALPDASVNTEGQAVWGLFEREELVACRAVAMVEEATVAWSLATPPRLQGHGYGSRLIRAVLAESARAGSTIALAYCTPAGERATRRMGFTELERWQVWSRPRWVLARA